MSSGFNTDVKVRDQVFHVQTEDRGPSHPIIDTAVYQSGRILHRRALNYSELAESLLFTPEDLRRRVEEQHRAVIDDIRSGALDSEIASASAATQANRPAGIQLQLLNPGSWLSAGKVSLEVEVSRRADRQPQVGANVEAFIEGALDETRHPGTSDEQGRVRIQFSLPPLGKGDLTLVIHASTGSWKDEIRFTMRSRQKESPASPAP
ncbi:MAG: hypothetical protein ABSF40_08775 [Candidatus Acidiferrales bacterium]|jgi:hypothetical protein